LVEQKNLCALCQRPFTKDDPPHADHRHSDLTPRGLLHNNCNVALGFLEESPELCRMAADYLEYWEEIRESQVLLGRLG
jgi:hypothetical protein